MEKEIIIRFWRIAYIKVFDESGYVIQDKNHPICFRDKKAVWEAYKIVGNFYYLILDSYVKS